MGVLERHYRGRRDRGRIGGACGVQIWNSDSNGINCAYVNLLVES